jgi:aminoglycoside phosphotransferase (APT) family kinase protein
VGSRTLLAGGYRNEVWKVRTPLGTVIEKRYAEDPGSPNPMYPNLPDHEAGAMTHLAGSGCAPELVSYQPADDAHGAVVTYRYVSGSAWQRGVADVAELLHRVHHVPPPDGMRVLHPGASAARIHADEMIHDTTPSALRNRLLAARPASVATDEVRRPSLVHTDCGPGNVIRHRDGIVLIDWQCPGLGDPVEDVACFLSPAMMILYDATPHGARARATFLDAYADASVVARYRRDGAAWHYRIGAYCVWRAARLARRQPEVAARYRRALTAELELLEAWR